MELETSSLPVFIPTENRRANHGEMRNCFVLNPNCGKGEWAAQELEMLYFLGILIGYGLISTNPFSVNLHPIFWKQVVGITDLNDEADLYTTD